jgi:replicative superfamily II helicase
MKVRLLIIDEVHLLHDDRGAVLESLVARTLRLVESSQSMIRIVGLSATLPNYTDVADFLKVNRHQGLFFFDSTFRPVPLGQNFIGVKGGKPSSTLVRERMNQVMFDKILDVLEQGRQAMVFVHARKDTVRTGFALIELAEQNDASEKFQPSEEQQQSMKYQQLMKEVDKSRNREMKELIKHGIGVHNAGMLRADRTLVERMFEAGYLRVLVCTATLAWGVNLPAYAVIIKGTTVYDSQKGAFTDLSILDVMQIFGRAV